MYEHLQIPCDSGKTTEMVVLHKFPSCKLISDLENL